MNKVEERKIRSKLLEKYTNIDYGFGTKHFDAGLLNVVTPHQVHGSQILWIDGQGSYEADGLVTDQKGIAIGVRTADCVPILLFEPDKKIVAAVHAGWKGTATNIVSKAVEVIEQHGGRRQDVVAAIGPHIGACCYYVNRVRISEMKSMMKSGNPLIKKRDNKAYLDLGEMNKQQLILAGVAETNVEVSGECTFHYADLFHSHRREGDMRIGQNMINFIVLT